MEPKIFGVRVKKLKWIRDERGKLMEVFRSDDTLFKGFGQAYITAVNPYFVKAWHMHKNQTDNIMCIKGKVKLVLYDSRKDSQTFGKIQKFFLSFEESLLVQVPPQVYHGFESLGKDEGAILNIPDKLYDRKNPDKYRLPFNTKEIPCKWNAKKGG